MLFCEVYSSIFLRHLILEIQIMPNDLKLITLFLHFENNKLFIKLIYIYIYLKNQIGIIIFSTQAFLLFEI